MFAKQFRLPSRAFSQNTFSQVTPFFILRFTPNNIDHNRYGFVVSKKIDKRAIVRNKTKRKIRSVIESLHKNLHQGYDMLFIIKKPLRKDSKMLEEVLKNVFHKEHLL